MIVTRLRPPVRRWEAAFQELERMRRQMADFADYPGQVPGQDRSFGMLPATNVTRDEDNFYVRMELPGIDPKELNVSVTDRTLSIAGTRELPEEEEGVSYHRRERGGGSFSRNLELPSDFERDRVEASYTNGILTITLPRLEAAKPKQISVTAS